MFITPLCILLLQIYGKLFSTDFWMKLFSRQDVMGYFSSSILSAISALYLLLISSGRNETSIHLLHVGMALMNFLNRLSMTFSSMPEAIIACTKSLRRSFR